MIKMCGASIACKTKDEGMQEVRVIVVSEPVNFIQSDSGMINSTRL